MRLLPLSEQVVVITGASSGIGRETALRMARAGATVVAIARDEPALAGLVAEIEAAGGVARSIVCDVADASAVRTAAELVERWFGRIDTWVNNAGVLLYAEFWRTTPEEFERITRVNYLGQIHGALAALPALRRAGGGALIAVASAESFLSLPFHSAYAASKAAVAAAMDGLRRDLIAEEAAISVTTVHPAVIDTPIYRTARNRMGREPSAPPPYYDAGVAAQCIVYAAEHPVRAIHAGGAARGMAVVQALGPGLVDALFGRVGVRFMHGEARAPGGDGNLDRPLDTGRIRGGLRRPGRRVSVSTWLAVRPAARMGLAAAGVALTAALLVNRRRR